MSLAREWQEQLDTYQERRSMTNPSAPRDVDFDNWLDGIGFKPANTTRKQQGHEAARNLVGEVGGLLHDLLPPGRDKSIVFTLLEDVLMRANRALALGGGPQGKVDDAMLAAACVPLTDGFEVSGDPRIAEYKAAQRGETPSPMVDALPQPVLDVAGDFREVLDRQTPGSAA